MTRQAHESHCTIDPRQEKFLSDLENIRQDMIDDSGTATYKQRIAPYISHIYNLPELSDLSPAEAAIRSLDVIAKAPFSDAKLLSMMACLEVIRFGPPAPCTDASLQ